MNTKHCVRGAMASVVLAAALFGGASTASAATLDASHVVTVSASSHSGYQVLAADSGGSSNSGDSAGKKTADAEKALKTQVYKDISGNQYQLDGGGTVLGSDVMTDTGDINDAIYGQMSKKGQSEFINDLVVNTKKYTDPTAEDYTTELATEGVDQSTADNWFTELRSHKGVGSKMLTEILKGGVRADLSAGSRWFAPFSGPLSSFLGFMAIVVISFMGIRSIVDLSYIAIPYFQTAMDRVGDGKEGGKSIKLVSNAAKKAVEVAESGEKNPIVVYFTKAALEYIFLALAILFLCFNYMWDLAGLVMDGGMGLLGY